MLLGMKDQLSERIRSSQGIVGPQDQPIYSPHHLESGHYAFILPLSVKFNLKGIIHSEI